MRRAGHIRERSPGSFELRYSAGIDPATGKRKTVTTTFHGSRKEADKELRRLLHKLDTGEHVDPTRLTVAQWLDQWLETVKHEVAPKTHERYGELVRHYLSPEFGRHHLPKLSVQHIQTAYNRWASEGRRDGKDGGLSPRTRRHLHRVLKTALDRAIEQQLLARNPADAFKKRLPKVERREMQTLTPEHAKALLDGLYHTRVYRPSLVALATGMRRGEVLALRWKRIDFDKGVLRVMESLEQTKAGLRFKSTKTEKVRSVTLPAFAIDELRRIRRLQAEELLLLGVRQTADHLVCCREDGEPLQPRSLTHEFTRLVARIECIPRVRFHDLRHTHATQLLSSGVHPKVAQERLGHSTIVTTLDLYSHVTETLQEDAASRLDAAYRSAIRAAPRG